MLKNPPNRQGNPAIAESVILKIAVAPEAATGEREIRLASPNGLSNPLRFHVGQWLEYRGREDFLYRLTIGELPWVTGHFPLGGRAATDTVIELTGWNLPTNRLFIAARDMTPLVATLTVTNGNRAVSVLPFSVDTLAERTEQEPNDHAESAPAVAMPCFINGRIGSADDADVFRLEGREGEEFVAEVLARRLDSPLDSSHRISGAGNSTPPNSNHARISVQKTLKAWAPMNASAGR
ncbi:MAG: hypothetical protein ACYDC1_12870, partial [Limisphaerales bacterium]